MKLFVINNLGATGGTEKAVIELSNHYNSKIFDLDENNCNSRKFYFDYLNFSNSIKNKPITELHGFLEYSSFIVSVYSLLNNKKSIIWIRSSTKHKVGLKLGFYFFISLLISNEIIFQNICQQNEYLKKYKFLSLKKKSIVPIIKIKSNRKINANELKKGLMFAGRLEKSKGILEICDFCINNDIELHIYGYGSLENKIINFSKNENIFFHGKYKSFFELNEYRKLIMNSEFEGNPNVLYEALSMDIPVVIKRWNDCVESFFNEDDNYILFDNLSEIDIKKII